MTKYRLLLLLVIGCPQFLAAQVGFFFQPSVQGSSLNGLWMVRMNNTSGFDAIGTLKIKVTELSHGEVVSVVLPGVKLRAGMNNVSRAQLTSATSRYGTAPEARILSNTGKFPEGSYQYCFEFKGYGGKEPVVDENCFEHTIMPLTPLILTDPSDEAFICNTRPDLSWQPPMPVEPGTRFRLILVKTDSLEEKTDAIYNNKPIINHANILQSWLRFPANVPALEVGSYYAWQVLAYKDDIILVKSEVWRFKVECEGEKKPGAPFDSYRELKPVLEGDYFLAEKIVRFTFNNPYGPSKLVYTITDLADPTAKPKKLPELRAQTGTNNVDLNLEKNKFFKDGGQYLLKVKLAGQELQLRFIYKSSSLGN